MKTTEVEDVLSEISAVQATLAQRRSEKWIALIRAVCDKKTPSAEKVDAALVECGKSLDDLKAACQLQHQRRGWRAQYDACPAAREELERIKQQRDAALTELRAAEEKYREKTAPLKEREEQLERIIFLAATAETWLGQTSEESLRAREGELIQRRAKLLERLNQLEETAYNAEHNARVHSANAAKKNPGVFGGNDLKAKAACEEKAASARRLKMPLDAEADQINAEITKIQEASLQP